MTKYNKYDDIKQQMEQQFTQIKQCPLDLNLTMAFICSLSNSIHMLIEDNEKLQDELSRLKQK